MPHMMSCHLNIIVNVLLTLIYLQRHACGVMQTMSLFARSVHLYVQIDSDFSYDLLSASVC